MTGRDATRTADADLAELAALTFDFGNTLVRVDRAALRRAVQLTAERIADRLAGLAHQVEVLLVVADHTDGAGMVDDLALDLVAIRIAEALDADVDEVALVDRVGSEGFELTLRAGRGGHT